VSLPFRRDGFGVMALDAHYRLYIHRLKGGPLALSTSKAYSFRYNRTERGIPPGVERWPQHLDRLELRLVCGAVVQPSRGRFRPVVAGKFWLRFLLHPFRRAFFGFGNSLILEEFP
jgi:hypothetical protein